MIWLAGRSLDTLQKINLTIDENGKLGSLRENYDNEVYEIGNLLVHYALINPDQYQWTLIFNPNPENEDNFPDGQRIPTKNDFESFWGYPISFAYFLDSDTDYN